MTTTTHDLPPYPNHDSTNCAQCKAIAANMKCLGCKYRVQYAAFTGTGSFNFADGIDGLCSTCRDVPAVVTAVEAAAAR